MKVTKITHDGSRGSIYHHRNRRRHHNGRIFTSSIVMITFCCCCWITLLLLLSDVFPTATITSTGGILMVHAMYNSNDPPPHDDEDEEDEEEEHDDGDDRVVIDENGCKGGTCPTPTIAGGSSSYGTGTNPNDNDNNDNYCGLWMGPSPIKNVEEHGFGLGLFTGIAIPMGKSIEETFFGHGEILLAIYASESIYNDHPPLREYIWDEGNMPEIAVEYPDLMTGLFIPGLAAIAPCTSQNYNLKLVGHGTDNDKDRWSATSDDGGVHRSQHPQAGAFSYRHNVTYVAVRDIAPGEELTVDCSDSNFDGGAYYLSRYSPEDDNNVVCLDQNLRVDKSSPITDAMGLGVFAKRDVNSGSILISTPLVPIHRHEMDITDDDVGDKQLMLNYVYGHPDSDLLLLPNGPIVNYMNHHPDRANAKIRWHQLRDGHRKGTMDGGGANSNNNGLDRRQEYHHPELFSVPAELVAKTHGKGLLMDIVATRDITEGEEIFLDYGKEWQQAWDKHKTDFDTLIRPTLSDEDIHYQSAERILAATMGRPWKTTLDEGLDPYPPNVETFCFYEQHDDDTSNDNSNNPDDEDADPERKNRVSSRGWRKYSWNDHPTHPCFRPCTVIERVDSTIDGVDPTYTVEMFRNDNPRVMYYCSIGMDYMLFDVPHADIRLLDKPYTTDVLRKGVFRHEIGVPDGFYPDAWMRKKLRSRVRSAGGETMEDGDEFKRKEAREKITREVE